MSEGMGFYSPDEVIVLIGGVSPARLLSDDSFISISRSDPAYSTKVTPDGLVTRTKNASVIYEVRISLMSGSPTNDVLQTMYTVDNLSGRGKFPLLIKDALGGDMFFATNCWIEESPVLEFGTEAGNRDWVIRCGYAQFNVGGSQEFSSGVSSSVNKFLQAAGSVADFLL